MHFQLGRDSPHPTTPLQRHPTLSLLLDFFKEKLKSWLFTQVTKRRFCEGFLHLNFSGKALNTHRPTWNILSYRFWGDWEDSPSTGKEVAFVKGGLRPLKYPDKTRILGDLSRNQSDVPLNWMDSSKKTNRFTIWVKQFLAVLQLCSTQILNLLSTAINHGLCFEGFPFAAIQL